MKVWIFFFIYFFISKNLGACSLSMFVSKYLIIFSLFSKEKENYQWNQEERNGDQEKMKQMEIKYK